MKIQIRLGLIVVPLSLLFASATLSASAFDSTPPVIDSCSITPNKLTDAGGQITTSVHITSVNGLLNDPVGPVYLENNTSRQLGGLVMTLTEGDRKSGTYKQTFTVPANLMPGRYILTIFPLTDVSQNSSSGFYKCPNAYIDYGTSSPTLPTPSASPKASATPSATSTPVISTVDQVTIDSLKAQIASLTTYKALSESYKKINADLTNKIAKICSAKPKPRGC